jgi:hypothetical protein
MDVHPTKNVSIGIDPSPFLSLYQPTTSAAAFHGATWRWLLQLIRQLLGEALLHSAEELRGLALHLEADEME